MPSRDRVGSRRDLVAIRHVSRRNMTMVTEEVRFFRDVVVVVTATRRSHGTIESIRRRRPLLRNRYILRDRVLMFNGSDAHFRVTNATANMYYILCSTICIYLASQLARNGCASRKSERIRGAQNLSAIIERSRPIYRPRLRDAVCKSRATRIYATPQRHNKYFGTDISELRR